MGTGAAKRVSAVRWGVAGNIVTAWVLTLPAAAAVGGLTYAVVALLGTEELGPIAVSAALLVGARRGARPPAGRRPDAHGGGLMPILAVDIGLLWQVIWVSVVAGVGISALFSLVILGGARAGDARRAGRDGAALGYVALASRRARRCSASASCSACRR